MSVDGCKRLPDSHERRMPGGVRREERALEDIAEHVGEGVKSGMPVTGQFPSSFRGDAGPGERQARRPAFTLAMAM
jgi:hypothetical protein